METDIPDIGSDQWRYWVVERLRTLTQGEASDADIALVIGTAGTDTRRAIDALIAEGDQEVIRILSNVIGQQLTTFTSRANRYADGRSNVALENANKYTDERIANGETSGVTAKYVDDGDKRTLQAADTAAGDRDNLISTTLKTYADDKANAALTSAKAAAASADADVLTAAKKYADEHGGSGGGVSESYVTDAVAQGVEDAGTAAALADDAVEGRARTYTDKAVSGVSTADRAYADQRASQAQTDAEAAAVDGDTATLQAANGHTDTAIDDLATNLSSSIDAKVESGVNDANNYTDAAIINAGTGSGVTQAYVDQQDSLTLNAAKSAAAIDAQSKADAVNTALRAYVDGKITDTGWLNIQPISGYQNQSTLEIRAKNGLVRMRGALYADSGNLANVAAVLNIATATLRPKKNCGFTCPGVGSAYSKLYVYANGNIDVTTPSAATTYLLLDSLSWFND